MCGFYFIFFSFSVLALLKHPEVTKEFRSGALCGEYFGVLGVKYLFAVDSFIDALFTP